MRINDLHNAENSKKQAKRLGRGIGSGLGKTSGKGQKGQNARSGGGVRLGFEGGQMPLLRRLPKLGFTNKFRTVYTTVNVEDLNRFEDETVVDFELLSQNGLVKKAKNAGLKVLGNGELKVALKVKANKFTQQAKDKILAQGGSVEEV